MTEPNDPNAKKKEWVARLQLGATVLGAAVVVVLRLRGIRYFGFVPTLVLIFVPILAGSLAQILLSDGPRRRAWIGWIVAFVLLGGITAWAAVGETNPMELLPPR